MSDEWREDGPVAYHWQHQQPPRHERENSMPARTSTRPAAPQKKEYPRIDGAISGNLTRDPELRFTASGRAVCNFAVACNDRVKNEKTGEWEDAEPEFHNVTVWGDMGERMAESTVKGDRVILIGHWQDRDYVNADGEKRTVTDFTAKDAGPSALFRDFVIKRPQRSTTRK